MSFIRQVKRLVRTRASVIAALCLAAQGSVATGQEKQSALPEGPGKDSLQKVCSSCHELETVISTRRTPNGWRRMMEDMVARGAEGSDEDMAAIFSYLTTFFGKVNVNAASAQELEKSLGLTGSEAQAILSYRERNGAVKDFEELQKIPGVSAGKLQPKRAMIAFKP